MNSGGRGKGRIIFIIYFVFEPYNGDVLSVVFLNLKAESHERLVCCLLTYAANCKSVKNKETFK